MADQYFIRQKTGREYQSAQHRVNCCHDGAGNRCCRRGIIDLGRGFAPVREVAYQDLFRRNLLLRPVCDHKDAKDRLLPKIDVLWSLVVSKRLPARFQFIIKRTSSQRGRHIDLLYQMDDLPLGLRAIEERGVNSGGVERVTLARHLACGDARERITL